MNDSFDTNDTQERPRENNRGPREERSSASQRKGGFSFNDMTGVPVHTTLGGITDALIGQFTRALENAGSDDNSGLRPEFRREKFKLVPIPASVHTQANPSLLVALPTQIGGKPLILVYVLVFESAVAQPRRTMQDRGDTYEALILPEDALNERYRNLIVGRLTNYTGDVKIIGQQVVSNLLVAKLDPSKDDMGLIAPVIDNAFNAICTAFDNFESAITGNRSDTTITPDSLAKGQRFECTYDMSGQQGLDTSLLPIRTDIKATLLVSSPIPDEEKAYFGVPISETRVALDLWVSPSDEDDDDRQRGFGGRRRRRNRDEVDPFLQAVLNINSIVPLSPTVPFNLGHMLLNLDTVIQLTNKLRWARALAPRPYTEGSRTAMEQLTKLGFLPTLNPDEKDLAEVELPANLDNDDLADFLDGIVHPSVAVAMTIPSTGDRSWVMSFWSELANNPADAGLLKTLRHAADAVTGGIFSDLADRNGLLDRGDNIVQPIATRVLIGHWTDDAGNIRSLSEWNVPAVRSYLGSKRNAVEMALEYQDTFENTDKLIEHNLADRFDMLSRFVREPKVVGTADQITFTPDFLETLSQAIADARMDAVNMTNTGDMGRSRTGNLGYGQNASRDLGASSRRESRGGRDRGSRRGYDLSDRGRY